MENNLIVSWRDCDKVGHEVDCFVALLSDGFESYDCED